MTTKETRTVTLKLAIASGKGGTGKTTVAVNLFHLGIRGVVAVGTAEFGGCDAAVEGLHQVQGPGGGAYEACAGLTLARLEAVTIIAEAVRLLARDIVSTVGQGRQPEKKNQETKNRNESNRPEGIIFIFHHATAPW